MYPARELRLDQGDVVPLLLEFGRYETVVTSGNAFSRAALESNLPIPRKTIFALPPTVIWPPWSPFMPDRLHRGMPRSVSGAWRQCLRGGLRRPAGR